MTVHHYDIIGDVHGFATLLKRLLVAMGYSKTDGAWKHPHRTAIFVGDFINHGPEIRETLQIVRAMTEKGSAKAILGNHEYSAILYHIKDSHGLYLSRHIARNRNMLQSTLSAFKGYKEEWREYLKWFRTLPFTIDLGKIRISHAYWNDKEMQYLNEFIPPGKLKKSLLRAIHEVQHPVAGIIYKTLKGLEFQCPPDLILKCTKGVSRKIFRMNWWESPENKNFRQLSFGNKFILPEYRVPVEIAPSFETYGPEKPIVFIGHYCLSQGPAVLQPNICCVDGCVVTTKQLSAYQWNGESELRSDHLITV